MLEGVRRLLNPAERAFCSDKFFDCTFNENTSRGFGVTINVGPFKKQSDWCIDFYPKREGTNREEAVVVSFFPLVRRPGIRRGGITLAVGCEDADSFTNATRIKTSRRKFIHRAATVLTHTETRLQNILNNTGDEGSRRLFQYRLKVLETLREKVTILNAPENDIVYEQKNFIPDGGPHTNGDVIYGPRRQSP